MSETHVYIGITHRKQLISLHVKQFQVCHLLKVVETGSDDSFSDEDSPKKRRDILTRRPSYRKILNDLGGGEITGKTMRVCNIPIRRFIFHVTRVRSRVSVLYGE